MARAKRPSKDRAEAEGLSCGKGRDFTALSFGASRGQSRSRALPRDAGASIDALHRVAHAAHAGAGRRLLRSFGDDRLGREDVLRDRRGLRNYYAAVGTSVPFGL